MYRYLVRALLLANVVASQQFQRDYDAPSPGLLGKKIQKTPDKSLDGGMDWGNGTINPLDDNVFLGSMGLSKRQSCGSGSMWPSCRKDYR